jgi:two-component system, cell cycle response regulator
VYSPTPNAFDVEDITTLELMVAFIAAAMSNALAQRALMSSEQRFRSLAELASDGIITTDACGSVTYVNRSAAHLFGSDERGLIGRPMLSLMPQRFALTLQDSEGNFDPERARKLVGKTLEVMGLRADGGEFPVELSASTWNAGNERFFTAIVRDITERKRLESAVLTLARTDHLTGLLNRRAGEELIERELDRAVRYGRALSFVLVDIDHFKRVNDTFGHAAGDAVLRRMGQLVVARIRATDLAVRWGGEELLLCLPETDLEGAQDLAESLRSMIEQTRFEGVGVVSASLGVANRIQGERAEQTISRADERMYTAKSNGRNRVEI